MDMADKMVFTAAERAEAGRLEALLAAPAGPLPAGDMEIVRAEVAGALDNGLVERDSFGLNPVVAAMQTAAIGLEETGLGRDGVMAALLYPCALCDSAALARIESKAGHGVAGILKGLVRVRELYKKSPAVESENFRNLLLSFAEDMRVILIMIADRVNIMRQIRDCADAAARTEVSQEASYLYAPLAHKLGLYKLKSELEDLSLKYMEGEAYYMIKGKLNETKRSRDEYIERFIAPIRAKIEAAGLKFHMKGRTKSIHSIWQKMKKQKCPFEGIYDLFAIRVILDSEPEREKMECWQVYSIVTDMYQPNPKRLRDWLSVPKSNGYESLHITVLGPENKWVEVQIRTERMDNVAERGLAAHWRYKGVGGQAGIDEWLANMRAALEAGDGMQVMDQFRLDLYEEEVFVFTPKGDLIKFPKGATILDFAYHIHSKVGNTCVGGKVNGRNVPIRQQLNSGDTVEILTQGAQKPKADWLNVAKTARAKSKIRLALKETQQKEGLMARELLERRFKNRKIEPEESLLQQLISKMGFKENSEFYRGIAEERVDVNDVIERYAALRDRVQQPQAPKPVTAEDFKYASAEAGMRTASDDALVIGRDLKGLEYSLAKCCNPIYGDPVFGFVTISGGIKVHRMDCPNAPELRKRFGYRVVKARWSGKGSSTYGIALRVVGNDDIGVLNNITSVLSKDQKVMVRSVNIDSHDGLFSGNIEVMVEDTTRLDELIRRVAAVKGVKQVSRI